MKKYILLVLTLFCFLIITPAKAENYSKFTVYASFDNVDKETIPSIVVSYEVFGEENLREVTLSKDNDFTYTSSDIPKGDILFDSGYVIGDKTGKYDVICNITKNGTDEIYMNVTVKGFEATSMTSTKTTLTTSTSTTPAAVEEKEETKSNNTIVIIFYSALAGIVIAVLIIVGKKISDAEKFY